MLNVVVSSKILLHEPAFYIPVCSDPSSFNSKNTNKTSSTMMTKTNKINSNKVVPLNLNNQTIYFPMVTTEWCLVASTNREYKAITSSKEGVHAFILKDGISWAPVLRCPESKMAISIKLWCDTKITCSDPSKCW